MQVLQHSAKYSSHSVWMWGIFYKILAVPQNTVMDLNNVLDFADNFIVWVKDWHEDNVHHKMSTTPGTLPLKEANVCYIEFWTFCGLKPWLLPSLQDFCWVKKLMGLHWVSLLWEYCEVLSCSTLESSIAKSKFSMLDWTWSRSMWMDTSCVNFLYIYIYIERERERDSLFCVEQNTTQQYPASLHSSPMQHILCH